MGYLKFFKVLSAVASSLFLFCTCHASAMDKQKKPVIGKHDQETCGEDLEKKYIDVMLEYQIFQVLRECDEEAKPITKLLAEKTDKIVIEDSAKQELKRLGVENIDSIPINVLAYNFGLVAPAKKYLDLGYGSIVPDGYIKFIRKNVENCNSIRLLNHPKEGIVLAYDNVAIVLRKKTVPMTIFGFMSTETAFSLDKVNCNN